MTFTKPVQLLAASLCVVAPSALAQDRLETVIVTTIGPDREADELIGNANSLDRDDLVQNLSSSLGDTLDREPGVASTYFGAGASRPVLRGLGAERVLVLTNGIGVVDVSAASPDHQVASDAIDAERIEILRGPAALAYGGQAIGGVVNVIDGLIVERLPEDGFSADAFAAYTSVNDGTEAAGRGQFVNGPFVFTLSASARDLADFDIPGEAESAALIALEEAEMPGIEHEEGAGGTVENSFVETQSVAAGVSWVGESGFLGLAVRQQTSTYGLPGHEHEEDHEGEGGEAHAEEELPFIDMEQTRVDLRGGWTIDRAGLTDLIVTLSDADYEHTEFEGPGVPGTVFKSDGTEARVELGHDVSGVAGALGLQYVDKEIGAFGDEAFLTPTTTEGLAVFAYETIDWDNGFGLEGGARLEQLDLSNQVVGDRSFDLFSASLGAHMHWNNGWFFGAQLAHTERAPNETELFADGPHLATAQYEIGTSSLEPEAGLNSEVSLRWQSETTRVGINLFVTDFSDFIYLAPGASEVDGLPVFVFSQQDADFHGGEIYGEWTWHEGWAGASWTADASVEFVEAELASGADVPFIPPLTWNAGAEASWRLWTIGGDVSIAADQDDPGAGQLPTDGYVLANLRAALDLGELGFGRAGSEAFLEVRNLGDEEVRYATSVLKDTVPAPGRGARIGVRWTY